MNAEELRAFDASRKVRLCGLDEAGRGPLAGPVTAGCVMLRPGAVLPFLNDSKRVSEKRREILFRLLTEEGEALAYGIGSADVAEIESLNILQAALLAMRRAYAAMRSNFPDAEIPGLALVDGDRDPRLPLPTELVPGGDGRSAHIAAASILAKVARDRLMREAAVRYPGYFWERNKGYGTRRHMEAIRTLGTTPLHRPSFLRKIPGRENV